MIKKFDIFNETTKAKGVKIKNQHTKLINDSDDKKKIDLGVADSVSKIDIANLKQTYKGSKIKEVDGHIIMSINENIELKRGEVVQSFLEQVTGKWDIYDFKPSTDLIDGKNAFFYDEKYLIFYDENIFEQWIHLYEYESYKPEIIRLNGKFIAIFSKDMDSRIEKYLTSLPL